MKVYLIKTIAIIGVLFLTSSTNVFGQVYKLRSTSLSSRHKINDAKWSSWSDAEEANVLITFDETNNRITIYSKVTQVYDIAEYEGKTTDEDGDDIFSYYCIDKDGVRCRVKWLKLNSQNGRMQMYVYYSDLNWLYNVYLLD
ncbi:hypothetical protein [Flavobacterium sp.]|uniref:hypothetical protein n=1 Tax=Flavobacterium sp. TaxID=239 RepID=UPI00261271A2|nr:hypothetical protein [Flavobacterium sp.]